MKNDFSNETVFTQAWNLPLNAPGFSLQNVRCRLDNPNKTRNPCFLWNTFNFKRFCVLFFDEN